LSQSIKVIRYIVKILLKIQPTITFKINFQQMKKVLFGLLCAALLVCSCQSDDTVLSQPEVISPSSDLVFKLTELNDSLMSTNEVISRGVTYSQAYSYTKIAYKDIKGAYKLGKIGLRIGRVFGPEGAATGAVIGGLIGGAGYSYIEYNKGQTRAGNQIASPLQVTQAYISVVESAPTYSEYTPTQITLQYPTTNQSTQLMGAKHNLILQKLVDNELSLTPINKCLSPEEESIISSQEFEESYYAGLESESSNEEADEDIPDVVMRLYLDIFKNYPDKADDVEFITNKYIELVSASNELTEEEKEIIYSALSVAASSYEYWEYNLK